MIETRQKYQANLIIRVHDCVLSVKRFHTPEERSANGMSQKDEYHTCAKIEYLSKTEAEILKADLEQLTVQYRTENPADKPIATEFGQATGS